MKPNYNYPQQGYPNPSTFQPQGYPPGQYPQPINSQLYPPANPQQYPSQPHGKVPQKGSSSMSPNATPVTTVPECKPKRIQKYVHDGRLLPSLKPDLNAVAITDATIIHKAFGGIGCNQKKIINILTRRSSAQREKIKSEYDALHSKKINKTNYF
uniref:Annexin A7 (Trinotate prediction) n=1 Tax=Henneguya salminicola TaxID=69463 RepID=A0A6G3MG84_HENSL